MKVDIDRNNLAFKDLLINPDQMMFLDANFFIPPDRSIFHVKPYRFEKFKEIWIDPLLNEFSGLSIHEAVYDELVETSVKNYVDIQTKSNPTRLRIHYNSELNNSEIAMMNYYIAKIAIHSRYDPGINNAKDRGEVCSLAFMATKNYLYFAANDSLPIRLIKEADKLNTGLDNMGIIQMYELIYYLYKTGKYNNREIRLLYKYQYYLSPGDKKENPEWGKFIKGMDRLYINFMKSI